MENSDLLQQARELEKDDAEKEIKSLQNELRVLYDNRVYGITVGALVEFLDKDKALRRRITELQERVNELDER